MRDPAFWWRDNSLAANLLAPFAAVYGATAARRMAKAGARAGVPVICVGNFTLGGSGKTPTAIWLAKMLEAAGQRPCCLSRGYGGSDAGPKLVDPQIDPAAAVGDEALLLARAAPTIVSRDRVSGAELATTTGAGVIVMDDGLQNGSLAKDFTLAVVDGRRGIGNCRVFPAGPLRAPLAAQMAQTDAVLIIGKAPNATALISASDLRPVFHGRLVPDPGALAALEGRKVLAFAGIGDPDKFFDTLTHARVRVAEHRAFGDHHRFTGEEAAQLMRQAEHGGLTLLTTEKDRARMTGDAALTALAERVQVLPVTLVVDEADVLQKLIMERLRR